MLRKNVYSLLAAGSLSLSTHMHICQIKLANCIVRSSTSNSWSPGLSVSDKVMLKFLTMIIVLIILHLPYDLQMLIKKDLLVSNDKFLLKIYSQPSALLSCPLVSSQVWSVGLAHLLAPQRSAFLQGRNSFWAAPTSQLYLSVGSSNSVPSLCSFRPRGVMASHCCQFFGASPSPLVLSTLYAPV